MYISATYFIKKVFLSLLLTAVHPFGPVNLNESNEDIQQKISLMREIITQFKNNILTGIQAQPGSDQMLSNYISQLKVNYCF